MLTFLKYVLDVLEFGLGVSIYGNDEKSPEFDATAIVDLVPPARTLQMHNR